MRHLGDITRISGREAPPVDVVIGGSPCQDLSSAGNRAGLAGERSGLFMEQIRLIKEMRGADKERGRTGAFIRPRFMVWENVCFGGDTLVACESGYKKIKDVREGDRVKTHLGRYRPVAEVHRTQYQQVLRLRVSGAEDIIVTPNHPILAAGKLYSEDGDVIAATPCVWIPAWRLTKDDVIGYRIDTPTLPNGFMTNAEARRLGRWADDEREIPAFVFQMPFDRQKAFLDGYLSGPGHVVEGSGDPDEITVKTSRRETAYGIARLIRNLHRVPVELDRETHAGSDVYIVSARLTVETAGRIVDDYTIWQPVKSVEALAKPETVYNLSVLEDNTYGANDIVVHNCGAFSSNKGEDFRAVLEETSRIVQPDAVIPEPPGGKWRNSGCVLGDGWSIAWRVLDAQFWGVPQRRRRIALIADFGGIAAPEVLFVREGVCWDPSESGDARENAAARIEGGSGAAGERLTGAPSGDSESNGIAYCIQGNCVDRADAARCNGRGWTEDVSYILNTVDRPAVYEHNAAAEPSGAEMFENHAQDARVKGPLSTSPAVAQMWGTGGNNTPIVMERNQSGGASGRPAEPYQKVTGALCAGSHPGSYNWQDPYNDMLIVEDERKAIRSAPTRDAADGNQSQTPAARRDADSNAVVRVTGKVNAVRRLTPLECERLQGYPDGWTDIGTWTDSAGKRRESADAARYRALGNSIAIPPWTWVLKRLCACYERSATMASLFDGIGGFPLIWERLNGKGTCLWASEIEEFPIAVTRRRFGGD